MTVCCCSLPGRCCLSCPNGGGNVVGVEPVWVTEERQRSEEAIKQLKEMLDDPNFVAKLKEHINNGL